MMFQMNMGISQELVEAAKTCEEHPECVECPMVGGQVVNNILCETGRTKGEDK